MSTLLQLATRVLGVTKTSADHARAYIEELESECASLKRQADTWRGIAAAMGYEPDAHMSVRPTEPWLIERIAMFRARVASQEKIDG